jgi:predicted amidohydrolase
VRALLAQLEPVPGAPDANASRGAEIVRAHDAELVVFPELYLSGYDLRRAGDAAIEPDAAPIAALRRAAAETGTAVAIGFAERRGAALANSLALIDERGELVAVYRKVHLFGDELDAFEPGEQLVVAELAGRRAGALICFDMEFPEPARALAVAGADLLVTASANMEPFYGDHRIASQARALDNRLPHLYCNRCGEEAGLRFVGGSRALHADGTIGAEAGDGEQLLAVDAGPRGAGDDRVDYLAHRREAVVVTASTTATGGSR